MTMQRLKNILLFYIMKKKQYLYGHHGNTNGCMHVPLIIPVVLFKPKKNLLDANMHVN